jgi:hypothetical protein
MKRVRHYTPADLHGPFLTSPGRTHFGRLTSKQKPQLNVGDRPSTFLTPDVRKSIGEAYRNEEGSLRQLAARFGTSVGTIQRSITAR